MATLAEIRAKLKESEGRANGDNKTGGDNSIYPFWNLKEGGESVLRFLPDGNTDNTFFWVERAMIKLPFAGVKGESESKPVVVNVPCMEMYGETCPILSEVRPWFKDPSLEDMGRKYWKKRSYIFQGFVVEDGLKETEHPENPIRRFIIGPQIYQIIRSALMDPELEELPTDFLRGVDFRIAKTSKGGYADYSTSKWSRRERSLTDIEKAAIESHGLFDLSAFLPKKPTDVELKVMKEMFEASVDGQPYDTERWGQYYRPAGVNAPGGAETTEDAAPAKAAPVAAPAAKAVEEDAPFDTDDTPTAPVQAAAKPASNANDILAMIRARQNKQ